MKTNAKSTIARAINKETISDDVLRREVVRVAGLQNFCIPVPPRLGSRYEDFFWIGPDFLHDRKSMTSLESSLTLDEKRKFKSVLVDISEDFSRITLRERAIAYVTAKSQ